MTDKVQKIREKVVEIVNSINPFIPDEDGKNSDYEAGRLDAAIQILQIIDSSEEPINEDFEKIVEEIAEPTILNAYGAKELARRLRNTICGTSVSEDLEEAAKNHAVERYRTTRDRELAEKCKWSFKTGAKWQKEQMIAKAIDARCFGFQGAALFSFRLPAGNYLVGSKVKVIVIKED